MSEPVTDSSTPSNALSMLYEGLTLINGFVKFFGFFALFFFALFVGFLLLSGMVHIANAPSTYVNTAADITGINGLLFAVFTLVAVITGKVEGIGSAFSTHLE